MCPQYFDMALGVLLHDELVFLEVLKYLKFLLQEIKLDLSQKIIN